MDIYSCSSDRSISRKGSIVNKDSDRRKRVRLFGVDFQHVHITDYEQLVHFLKANQFVGSYVTTELPKFLEKSLALLGERELKKFNKFIREFSQKHKVSTGSTSDMKSLKPKANKITDNLIPGKANFNRPRFYEMRVPRRSSFSRMITLNSESILSQIENFEYLKNTESEYYYQPGESPSGCPDRAESLAKKISDLEILINQNNKYASAQDKSNAPRVRFSTERALDYIKYLSKSKPKYGRWCHRLLKQLIELILMKGKEILKLHFENLQNRENLTLSLEESNKTFLEFFYSQINDFWFKKDSFVDDKTFRMTCEVLEFLSLADLIRLKNSAKIEKHLKGSIELLKELDYTFSLDSKFAIIHKVLENISFLIHYTNDTDCLPGNELILNVFIWCIIKAKNATLKSTFRYLELFISENEKVGELGFIMTQLEASIMYIGECARYANFRKSGQKENIELGHIRLAIATSGDAKGSPFGPKPPNRRVQSNPLQHASGRFLHLS